MDPTETAERLVDGSGRPWPPGYRCALSVTIDVDGRYGEGNFRPDDMYWLSQTAYDPRGTERLLAASWPTETLGDLLLGRPRGRRPTAACARRRRGGP